MKKTILFSLSILLLALICGCGSEQSCTMDMEINYSGSDEYGNNVGSDPEYKSFSVKAGDELYETYGDWELNPDSNSIDDDLQHITVLKVKSDEVTFKLGSDKITLKYGASYTVPSAFMVLDGANYSYKITFKSAD